jgi:hypothetical protein
MASPRNRAAASGSRDDRHSAWTLYQAARTSYNRRDVKSAKLYFGLAQKLFEDSKDEWNANIARDWYNSIHNEPVPK